MDWITIITGFLLPLLAKCQSKQSEQDPQEYLRSKYDAASGKFHHDVVISAIPQTRRSIRKAMRSTPRDQRGKFPRYSRDELYSITESALHEAMNATPEQAAAVMSAANELPEDDE